MLVGSLDDFGGIASSGTYDFGGAAGSTTLDLGGVFSLDLKRHFLTEGISIHQICLIREV